MNVVFLILAICAGLAFLGGIFQGIVAAIEFIKHFNVVELRQKKKWVSILWDTAGEIKNRARNSNIGKEIPCLEINSPAVSQRMESQSFCQRLGGDKKSYCT